ncbi:ComEC/Rec2 family competence protein [Dermabacteraceae bacterium P13088]
MRGSIKAPQNRQATAEHSAANTGNVPTGGGAIARRPPRDYRLISVALIVWPFTALALTPGIPWPYPYLLLFLSLPALTALPAPEGSKWPLLALACAAGLFAIWHAGQVAQAKTGYARETGTAAHALILRTDPARKPNGALSARARLLDGNTWPVSTAEAIVRANPGTQAHEVLASAGAGSRLEVRGAIRSWHGRLILTVKTARVIMPGSAWRQKLRRDAREASEALPADRAALVRGMAYGDTDGLTPETEAAMQRSGLGHLVAVSGANLALVMATLHVPLLLSGVPRKARVIVAALAAYGYLQLVGNEPSVQRAATMAVPVLISQYLGWRPAPLTALALAVTVWCLGDPQTVTSYGFVLSVLATAAIITCAKPCARLLNESLRLPEKYAYAIALPLVAQAACTPVLLRFNPETSLWAVPANLAATPFVGAVTVLGLAATLTAPLQPGIATALFHAAGLCAEPIRQIALAADRLPLSRIPLPAGNTGTFAIAAIFIAAALAGGVYLRRLEKKYMESTTREINLAQQPPRSSIRPSRPIRPRHLTRPRHGQNISSGLLTALALLLTAALVGVLGWRALPAAAPQDWLIAACDVGQGDAILLRDGTGPGAAIALIDTGEDEATLAGCLKHFGIERIDLFIRSHPDRDHIGAAGALTGKWQPRKTWACPLDEQANADLVPYTGYAENLGRVHIEVLWPRSDSEITQAALNDASETNDCSLSIRADWDGADLSLVSLGDLEEDGQRRITADARPARVVKVSHHGSAHQHPPLYAALQAELGIYSAGRHNRYGHPTARALALVPADRALRTDTGGHIAIGVKPDGTLTVTTQR